MASQQGRQQLLALLLLLLGQACSSIPAAASTSREGTILVSYDQLNRQQVSCFERLQLLINSFTEFGKLQDFTCPGGVQHTAESAVLSHLSG